MQVEPSGRPLVRSPSASYPLPSSSISRRDDRRMALTPFTVDRTNTPTPLAAPSLVIIPRLLRPQTALYCGYITDEQARLPPCSITHYYCELISNHTMSYRRVARWLSGRASDLRSSSRGFEPRPRRCCVTTLGKLFTPYCLCHQAV